MPEKVNYIWKGGSIPSKYLNNILRLNIAAENSNVPLILWVDNDSNYKKTWNQCVNSDFVKFPVQIRYLEELKVKLFDFIENKETRERLIKKFNSIVVQESVGYKNLAAASDLLRLEILRQEGGYYFDTDLIPHMDKFHSKLKLLQPKYGFMCEGESQKGTLYSVNNCILAASPSHPLLEKAILKIIENYDELKKDVNIEGKFFNRSDLKRNPILSERINEGSYRNLARRDATLNTSGPNVIHLIIDEYTQRNKLDPADFVFTNSYKGISLGAVTIETRCDNTWLSTCEIFFRNKNIEPSDLNKYDKKCYFIVKEEHSPLKVLYFDPNNEGILKDMTHILPVSLLSKLDRPFRHIIFSEERYDIERTLSEYFVKQENLGSFDEDNNRVQKPKL